MSEEKSITVQLLPAFDEVYMSHKELFNMRNFRGFDFTVSKPINKNIDFISQLFIPTLSVAISPNHYGQPVFIPRDTRKFNISFISQFSRGVSQISLGGSEAITDNVFALSQFLTGSISARTDYKSLDASAAVKIRQPWITIAADATSQQLAKPFISSVSAFIGNPNIGIGLKVFPNPKYFDVVGLTHFSYKNIMSCLVFSESNHLINFSIAKRHDERWTYGVNVVQPLMKMLPGIDFVFDLKKDPLHIRSSISSSLCVATNVQAKVNDSVDFSTVVELNHPARDYSLGIGITIHQPSETK